MKKKILNFIYSTRHKLKEGWAWHKSYFYFKWSIPFGAILQGIGFIFKTVVILASFFGIAFSSGMVFVTEQCIPYINIDFITEYITKEGLLSSQITLTLICVSLIALVANIENRYVYGEQSMNLAFPGRGPFSFKGAMAVSFLLLFVNIYWALKDVPLVYVALIFLITIYQSIWILYRFATVFLNQNAMKQNCFGSIIYAISGNSKKKDLLNIIFLSL